MDLSWAEDGSLFPMSKQHWKDGLWAFITCNANAWPGANKYLEETQADFVAIQEANLANAECADGRRLYALSGWKA